MVLKPVSVMSVCCRDWHVCTKTWSAISGWRVKHISSQIWLKSV